MANRRLYERRAVRHGSAPASESRASRNSRGRIRSRQACALRLHPASASGKRCPWTPGGVMALNGGSCRPVRPAISRPFRRCPSILRASCQQPPRPRVGEDTAEAIAAWESTVDCRVRCRVDQFGCRLIQSDEEPLRRCARSTTPDRPLCARPTDRPRPERHRPRRLTPDHRLRNGRARRLLPARLPASPSSWRRARSTRGPPGASTRRADQLCTGTG
jgi:hypothetical protein